MRKEFTVKGFLRIGTCGKFFNIPRVNLGLKDQEERDEVKVYKRTVKSGRSCNLLFV